MNNELENTKRRGFWPLYVSMFMLMIATVSPPLETSPLSRDLLPQAQLTQVKLVTRAFCAAVLIGMIFFLSYRKNAMPILIRFSPIIIYGFWAIASTSWSALPKTTLNQSGSFGILVLLSFSVSFAWESEKDTKRILAFLSVALLVISTMLIAMRFGAPQYGALTRDSDGLLHTTFASSVASLGFLIVLMSKLIWNWRWATQMIWICSPIHLSVILISGSRLSLALTGIIAVIAILLFCRRETVAALTLACGLIGTSYLLIDPSAMVVDKGMKKVGLFVAQGQTQSQFKSLSGRTEMWAAMMESHKDSPWKGHGYFCCSKTGELFAWRQWGNWTAHNMWLQLIVTTGLVGLAFFIGHLLVMGQGLAKIANMTDLAPRQFAAFVFLILLWYLGWGILNESIFGPTSPDGVVFFVISGLFIAVCAKSYRR